jgi:hypothetical protein
VKFGISPGRRGAIHRTIGARPGGQVEDKVLVLGHMACHVNKVLEKEG